MCLEYHKYISIFFDHDFTGRFYANADFEAGRGILSRWSHTELCTRFGQKLKHKKCAEDQMVESLKFRSEIDFFLLLGSKIKWLLKNGSFGYKLSVFFSWVENQNVD